MSEYCGPATTHTKLRGKIHRCDWCSQKIEIGESYDTWIYCDCGERSTVYVHPECGEAWRKCCDDEHGIVYADGGMERPAVDGSGDSKGGEA